jgi:hypothetical protein
VAGRPRGQLQEAIFHFDFFQSRAYRGHAFGVDIGQPAKDRSSQSLSAFYTLQKLAERHLEGSRKSCEMAKPYLAHTSFQIGDVDLMDSGVLREVDLSPAVLLTKLPDSFADLDADIRGHSPSIDLVEALYLVDALFRLVYASDRAKISRVGPKRNSPGRYCSDSIRMTCCGN